MSGFDSHPYRDRAGVATGSLALFFEWLEADRGGKSLYDWVAKPYPANAQANDL